MAIYAITAIITMTVLIGGYSIFNKTAHAAFSDNFDTSRLESNWGDNNDISPNPHTSLLFFNENSYKASVFTNPQSPGPNNRSSKTGYKHILKNSQTTHVERIEIYAYFNSTDPSNKNVYVRAPEDDKNWCFFGADDNKTRKLQIFTSTEGNKRSVREFNETANKNNSTSTCNKFKNFNFEFDNQQIRFDPKSGKFVGKIVFLLTGDSISQNIINQVSFTLRAPGATHVGLKGGTLVEQFGIQEDPNYGSAKYGLKVGIPFGVPCDDNDLILRNKKVELFDTDRDNFGNTYFYVIKRPVDGGSASRLAQNEYTYNTNSGNVEWVNRGSTGFFISTSLSNQSKSKRKSSVTIKKMSGDFNYMLVLVNPYQVGDNIPGVGTIRSSPVGNVLGLSVPTDTITGEIKCDDPDEPAADPYTSVRPPQYAYYADLEVDARVSVSKVAGENHPWRQYVSRYNSKPSFGGTTTTNSNGCSVIGGDCSTFKGTYYYDGSDESAERLNQSYGKSTPDPIGTWTCFVTRIRTNPETPPSPLPVEGEPGYPYTPPTPQYKYSAIDDSNCSLSVKYPKVQIQSHDLRVGGDANTSYEQVDSPQYGSWSEYAVMMNGCNQGGRTSSGAGLYRGSNTSPSSGLFDLNELSFANTGDVCDGGVGEYGGVSDFDEDDYLGVEENREDPGSTFSSSSVSFGTDANGKGIRKIYDHKGTLRITNNITYNDMFSSVRGIPRVIIAADDIIIDDDVTRIDAWLISRGSLSTCDLGTEDSNFQYSTALDADMCDKQVIFNGPVMASKIYLHRTYGSFDGEAESGDARNDQREAPAEVFNLRPDAFLSAYAGNNTPPVATTDYVVEVPPRF